jgi:Zinc carboxypeptidase
MRLRLTALAALLAAAVAVPASPAAQGGGDAFRQTLTATGTLDRNDCATKRLAGQPGVASTAWTPSIPVSLRTVLSAAKGSDWDLAVFDAKTGKRLGGSGGFNASEVVTAYASRGQALEIQACRLRGADTATVEIEATPFVLSRVAKLPPKPKMIEIELPYRESLGAVQSLGIDTVDNPHAGGIEALVYSDDELRLLEKAGFEYTVEIADLAKFDAEQQRRTARYAAATRRSPLPSGREEYRVLEDYQTELKTLAEQYPAIVRPLTLPNKTWQGREQFGVEISSDVHRADDQKPVAFLMGMHHAREWPSAELIHEMALYLAYNFGTDAQVTELLRHARVVIVPIINPDGFVSSRNSPSIADESGNPFGAPATAESAFLGGSFAYRRKNCKGPGGPSAPCDLNSGVDPNRNYGFGWGGKGASTNPESQTYRGPGPFSEEETQSVWEYSQAHDVTSMLSMHNFGSLVLRPPGRRGDGLAPDEDRLKALGDLMEADTGYTSQYGWQLYDTSGTTEDWNYGAAGTFGYTMELGPSSTDGGHFHIEYERGVVEQWTGPPGHEGRGVRRALLRVVEKAATRQDHSSLVGRAPAGRILRLKKTFQTSTSPVCRIAAVYDLNVNPDAIPEPIPYEDRPDACIDPGDPILFDDFLEYTTRVPANSVFSWIVTPSTRPFEFKAGKREAWTLTCEDDGGKVYDAREVTIWRGEVQSFEMPCGGALPTSGPNATTPQTFEEAQRLALVDRTPPRTTYASRFTLTNRRRIVLGGGSRDSAPEGLVPRVAQVRVAIARRVGKRCRFLNDQGRFGRRTKCSGGTYVPARVRAPARAVRWNYSVGARLPKGRYFAWARGLDAEGNLERKNRKRNLLQFRIR